MATTIQAVIRPMLMDNAVLQLPQSYETMNLDPFEVVLCLSTALGKEYSFCVKIDSVSFGDLPQPKLYVDKELVSMLAEGDWVSLTPFNAPVAERITILISDRSSAIDGDWGSMLGDQMDGRIIDIGSQFTFTYPSSSPFILDSVLDQSLPMAPVRVLPSTQVFTKKMDDMEIMDRIQKANEKKIKRVEKFEKQMEHSSMDFVAKLKDGSIEGLQSSFTFTAVASTIFNGIKSILNDWKILNERMNDAGTDFTGGIDMVKMGPGNMPICLVDFFVSSRNQEGKIEMTIYAENNISSVNKDVTESIRKLAINVRTSARIVNKNCPNCDAAELDFSKQDEHGMMICPVCYQTIEVPARFRLN
ncbi:MAG: hypothetical protein INQ03_10955 [Candidatus Heimdallarchaeota archaeon]|nr:hypothetical protein [Candidatus Heimdallarchaeota archaeon]